MIIDEIKEKFHEFGVNLGDTLLVSSDIQALLPLLWYESKMPNDIKFFREDCMRKIINAVQELVGIEGTLLFPTYSWGFCHGELWSYEDTQGKTGALSNFALTQPDFVRTKHPIYSFAVWGKQAKFYAELKNTDSFSDNSPFHYLYKSNAKNISIGAENFFTFAHYVEQAEKINYRYHKDFTAPYKLGGVVENRTYSMFVRQLSPEVVSRDKNIMDFLQQNGAKKEYRLQNIPLIYIDLPQAYAVLANDIAHNEAKNIVTYLDN